MVLFLEMLINGAFILLYIIKGLDYIPISWNSDYIDSIINMGTPGIFIVLTLVLTVQCFSAKTLENFFRRYIFSLIIYIPLLMTYMDQDFAYWLGSAHLISSIFTFYQFDRFEDLEKPSQKSLFFKEIRWRPAQMILVSFAIVILMGTFLLMLPISTPEGESINFVDAFFMSTSATCVTGLAVKDIGIHFSFFGQSVILILIQIGGLSIMTLYSSLTLILGRNMGMKDRVIMQDLLNVNSLEDLFQMIGDILKYTFFIELWGTVLLTIAFSLEGFEFGEAFYYGLFHAISAFCNAGFSLFQANLESYVTNPLINGTIGFLVILGGLGFIVLKEVHQVILRKRQLINLGLHSKIVLFVSFVLIFAGAVLIFFGEFLHSLNTYTLWEKIQISFFQSITLRTAGFNTIPIDNFHTLYPIFDDIIYVYWWITWVYCWRSENNNIGHSDTINSFNFKRGKVSYSI